MAEQLRLQFSQPDEQSVKFRKLKSQVDSIEENLRKLAEATAFAEGVMRQKRNLLAYEMQQECRHQQKPHDWNELDAYYCPECGKPL